MIRSSSALFSLIFLLFPALSHGVQENDRSKESSGRQNISITRIFTNTEDIAAASRDGVRASARHGWLSSSEAYDARTRKDKPSSSWTIASAAKDGTRRIGPFSADESTRKKAALHIDKYLKKKRTCREIPAEQIIDAEGMGLEGLTEENLQPFFDIPIELNEPVIRVITYFTEGSGRPHFQRYLNRSTRWIPVMHEILKEYDLPLDLVYVSMIESGFSMHAYSHAHAVGPWQFIAPTAEIYNLHMDSWADERRDPIKATHAAARFLSWLYREFNDWNLAWAGYNGGPTRVRRNMNATGIDNYWELCEARRLPRETCGYVPKIMAAAIISRFPKRFGFEIESEPPFEFETVEIEAPTDLGAIGKILDVDVSELRTLNPELRRLITPPPGRGQKTYILRIPKGSSELFLSRRSDLEPSRFIERENYIVKRGDSLWRIARNHKTTVDSLIAANPSVNPQRLMPGMQLMVPLPPGARPAIPESREVRPEQPQGEIRRRGEKIEVTHTVRAGDTLWSIAQRHGVTTGQLISWNSLTARGDHVHIFAGQKIIVGHVPKSRNIPQESSAVHILQPGETLWHISRKYGRSIDELKALNQIDDARRLRAGQVIVVEKKGE